MYVVKVNSPLDFTLGDNPVFQGRVFLNGNTQGSDDLAFVTLRARQANNAVLLTERIVTALDGTGFSFTHEFTAPFDTELDAVMLFAVFPMEIFPLPTISPDTGAGASAIDFTFDPTSPVQTIPASGWMRINDEIITFTRISATKASIVTRGVFGTTVPAAHIEGSTARISETKNTFNEGFKIRIIDDIKRVRDLVS